MVKEIRFAASLNDGATVLNRIFKSLPTNDKAWAWLSQDAAIRYCLSMHKKRGVKAVRPLCPQLVCTDPPDSFEGQNGSVTLITATSRRWVTYDSKRSVWTVHFGNNGSSRLVEEFHRNFTLSGVKDVNLV